MLPSVATAPAWERSSRGGPPQPCARLLPAGSGSLSQPPLGSRGARAFVLKHNLSESAIVVDADYSAFGAPRS
jgi:hypothetical protein